MVSPLVATTWDEVIFLPITELPWELEKTTVWLVEF